MTRKYTPEDAVRIVVRRRWLLLVPLAIGLAAAGPIGDRVPERYRSETLIMVVPQRVPENYVKPTVTETIEERLPSINELILSRSRLERIIIDLDLYREARARGVMEDVVAQMRGDVTVALVGGGRAGANSFRVTYSSIDPATARSVTDRLASLYIEQNLLDREAQATSTSQFIETELETTKQELVEQEKRLEEYRRRYDGQLPSQLQGNLQAIQNAQIQLQLVSESANRARERRLLIERQLADAQALPPPPPPEPVAVNAPSATPAEQLEAAKKQLEAARLRFTPRHPDVIGLQQAIAELERRVAEEPPVDDPLSPEVELSPAEIAHEAKIRELQANLDVIDRQLAAQATDEAQLKKRIDEYQARVSVVPTRESELVELTRDYEMQKTAYESLVLKRGDSQIAANLERQQIGERFRIIDTASLAQKPYNQTQRFGMIAAGPLGGLALGLLLIGLLEYRDSSFRREEEVMQALSLPVLALVPMMPSDGERRAQRRRTLLMDAVGVCALLTSVASLAIWRLQLL